MVAIQLAEQKHEQAITACVRAAYRMYIARMGKKPAPMLANYAKLIEQNVVYIATDSEEVVGLIVFYPQGESLLIENVAIYPEFQGRGIGRKLIEFALESAKTSGLKEISLYTNELMVENIRYYKRLGFIEVGRRCADGYRRVFFVKPVSGAS